MTAEPSELLEWATAPDPADIVDPVPNKASGWTAGQIPPRGWMNWLFQKAWQWTVYFRDALGELHPEPWVPGTGGELLVTPTGPASMTVNVAAGEVWIGGKILAVGADSELVSVAGLAAGKHRQVAITVGSGGSVGVAYGSISDTSDPVIQIARPLNQAILARFTIDDTTTAIASVTDVRQRKPVSNLSIQPYTLPESLRVIPQAQVKWGAFSLIGTVGLYRRWTQQFTIEMPDEVTALDASVFGGSGMELIAELFKVDTISASGFAVALPVHRLLDPANGAGHLVGINALGSCTDLVAGHNFGVLVFFCTDGADVNNRIQIEVPTGQSFPGGDFLLRITPAAYPGLSTTIRFTLAAVA